MKSKPVSQSSPETGDARRDAEAPAAEAEGSPAAAEEPAKAAAEEPAKAPAQEAAKAAGKDARAAKASGAAGKLAIELEVSRNRFLGWTVFGIVFGALLVWKLGTVGQWVGVALIVTGAYRGFQLAQTFLYPPGTIVVGDDEVILPRGLCLPRPIKVPAREVTAAYFLRRSVPWNRAAPVLVVEMGPRAMAYPRDWFASEAEQRRIIDTLLRVREGAAEAPKAS